MRNILLAACATAALAACDTGMGRQSMTMGSAGAMTGANTTDTTNSNYSAPAPIFEARGKTTPPEERDIMNTTGDENTSPAPIGTIARDGDHRFPDRAGPAPAAKASNYMDTTNSTVTDPGASGSIPTAETASNISGGAPTLNERRSPMSGRRSATGSTVVAPAATMPAMETASVEPTAADMPVQRRYDEIARMSAADLMGTDVVDPQGKRIGEVTGVIPGAGGDGVRAVTVEAGSYLGTGPRTVVVDVAQLSMSQGDGGELVTTMRPDRVTQMRDASGRDVYVLSR